MLLTTSFCFAVVLTTCTGKNIITRNQRQIIQTTPSELLLSATEAWFPGQVKLRSFGRDFNSVLVGERWVLTAASIFRSNYNPAMWNALVIAKDNSSPGQTTLHVQSILLYGGYKENSHSGDIALVKLLMDKSTLVNLNLQAQTRFAPVDLPAASHLNQSRSCYLIGWKYPDNVLTRPQNLRITPVSLLNTTQCNQDFGSSSASPGELCLASDDLDEGPCQGDQGSPVLCQYGSSWTVEGIVSREFGCGATTETTPGTFVDVAYYIPWINKVMAKF